MMMLNREVRRVPLDFEHPKRERFDPRRGRYVESFQPVFDRFYVPAVREWLAGWERWQVEPSPHADGCTFEEYEGGGPDPDFHYPGEAWPAGVALGICMYETTSEGTPISAVYPDTDAGRLAMAEELARGSHGFTAGMSVADWHRVIGGRVMAKDVHSGELS